MIIPCEIAVKTVSPALRALLAKTLLEKHDLKQTQVADVLGITQSAVSKYFKNVRGTYLQIENHSEVNDIVNQMATLLLSDQVPQTEIMKLFCQACVVIRSKGLMCPVCQQNQKSKINSCNFCNSNLPVDP